MSNRHLADKYLYAGEHETQTGIRLTQYNEQTLRTKEVLVSDPSFNQLAEPGVINWFEVSGLTNAEAITRIVKDFGMHNLDAKDILTPQHVVKIEEYKGKMLIILNSCSYDENNEMRSEHISILVAGNTVITFTESDNPVFEVSHKALSSNMLNIRKRGTGLLLAFLMNSVIANLVESASKVEEMLEDIEEALLDPKYPEKQPALEGSILEVITHGERDHHPRDPPYLRRPARPAPVRHPDHGELPGDPLLAHRPIYIQQRLADERDHEAPYHRLHPFHPADISRGYMGHEFQDDA